MATKTISLELDAYEKLRSAKNGRESFSSVVRRAIVPGAPMSGKDLVAYFQSRTNFLSEESLDEIEAAADADQPATNPWDEEPE